MLTSGYLINNKMKEVGMRTYQVYTTGQRLHYEAKWIGKIKRFTYRWWPHIALVTLLVGFYYYLINLGQILWVLSTPIVNSLDFISKVIGGL